MAKRMFIAIDLPQQVAEVLSELDPHLPDLRWLDVSQLHLTLCFLENVPESNEERLIKGLGEIHMTPFPLVLKGLGSFGRSGQPAVVWVGVDNDSPCPFRLQCRVRDAVHEAGLAAEKKPFHPHITVGRGKGLSETVLCPFLQRHAASGFGSFDVGGFTLYASFLQPEGAEYQPVFRQDFVPEELAHPV